jgi:hypothetical protein
MATERSVETFRQATEKFADQANAVTRIPAVDLTLPMAQYFDYLQQVIDVNRDLANRWADLLTSLSDSFREQSERITGVVKGQTEKVADAATDQVKKAEELAQKQADEAEQIEKEQIRQAKAAERAAAKAAHAEAREKYEDLTKAELADQLAERGLPKTGNLEDLIERLVSSDFE